MKGLVHEGAINIIADRLYNDIQPKSLRVIGDFMRRGNVKTVITVNRGLKMEFPLYTHSIL